MREIKFRVWNTVHKRMDWAMQVSGNKIIQDEHNMVLQFTGLKDKNGKEIYEGDIINDFGNFEGADRIGFVIFLEEHGAFMFDGFCGYPYFVRQGSSKECEIIGNKFENPELLDAKGRKNA